MRKLKIIGLTGVAIWLCVSLATCKRLRQAQGEIVRLRENQAALVQEMTVYENREGKRVAEVQALQLKRRELETVCASLEHDIEQTGIKLKAAEAAVREQSELYIKGRVVRDTIVVHDETGAADTTARLQYRDTWASVCVVGDTAEVRVQDTLTVVTWVKRKRLLGIPRPRKTTYRTTVVHACPWIKTTQIESVRIER